MKRQAVWRIGVAILGTVMLTWVLIRAPHPLSADAERQQSATTAIAYVVKEWGGKLAVFRQGESHPEMVYEDVAVITLPPEEQKRLQEGIFLPDRASLNRLLEDYTS